MEFAYARRMEGLKASEVRELLKVTEDSEVISFGGGLPAPELFPLEEIKAVSALVLEEKGTEALQYTTTEGYTPLREWIARRNREKWNAGYGAANILLTNGSQQALDLSGKVFLDEGDVVLCESPTYLSAIGAFRAYGCSFVEVATDDGGMVMEELERLLKETAGVKLIYVVPDFQNPTGRSWTVDRRRRLAELAAEYGVVVIEDNPYGELRFEGEDLPPVKHFDKAGRVLCLGTFSKTFCPGYRIGWIAGPEEVIDKFVLAKQGTDLQCNTLAQREIAKYLELYDIDQHIGKIKEVYRRRRNLAVNTILEEFPQGTRCTQPQGGLFLWVELPGGLRSKAVLEECVKEKVVFVPGDSFFPNGGVTNAMRINFSNMPEDKIVSGLKSIAGVLRKLA